MADLRIKQSIAERFDLEIGRHPDPIRRWRRGVCWFCGLLAVSLLCYFILRGDKTVYQSRPVSTAHRLIENDCRACHDKRWQPLRRVLAGDIHARSVSEQACRQCHLEQSHDHHPHVMRREAIRDCIVCHREHRGRIELARVVDQHCTGCHADLRCRDGVPTLFAAHIPSFAEHVEFMLRRPTGPGSLPASLPEQRQHLALEVAYFDQQEQRWVDKAAIHFNHQKHLNPHGLPLPPGHPQYGDGRYRKKLTCNSCHELAADGATMKPIRYQRHCSQCHVLDFDERLQEIDATLALRAPLPHLPWSILRSLLRDRLFAFADRYPQRLRTGRAASDQASRLPHKPPPDELPEPSAPVTAAEKMDWVRAQLTEVEQYVLARPSPDHPPSSELSRRIAAGCAHCHQLQALSPQQAGAGSRWKVLPPAIPTNWLRHSRFRHDRHATMQCADCHYRTPPDPDSAVQTDTSVYASTSARDILLPSIATCKQCHASGNRSAGRRGARADCVQCHVYHHGSADFSGVPLNRLLGESG